MRLLFCLTDLLVFLTLSVWLCGLFCSKCATEYLSIVNRLVNCLNHLSPSRSHGTTWTLQWVLVIGMTSFLAMKSHHFLIQLFVDFVHLVNNFMRTPLINNEPELVNPCAKRGQNSFIFM